MAAATDPFDTELETELVWTHSSREPVRERRGLGVGYPPSTRLCLALQDIPANDDDDKSDEGKNVWQDILSTLQAQMNQDVIEGYEKQSDLLTFLIVLFVAFAVTCVTGVPVVRALLPHIRQQLAETIQWEDKTWALLGTILICLQCFGLMFWYFERTTRPEYVAQLYRRAMQKVCDTLNNRYRCHVYADKNRAYDDYPDSGSMALATGPYSKHKPPLTLHFEVRMPRRYFSICADGLLHYNPHVHDPCVHIQRLEN